MKISGKIKAFTLAEVLITLGIIGVVAAMTIPTLINNNQDAQFKAGAKKAYSVASSAVQQMKQDEGGTLNNYIVVDGSFKPVFMTYFKIIKDCGTASCVPEEDASSVYNTIGGVKASTTIGGGEGQFITTDGQFFNIQNDISYGQNIFISVDVNGYTKKPNIYGKDTFVFQILNDNLVPMGGVNTWFAAPGYCDKTNSNIAQGFGCMSNVMNGIDY